MPTPSPPRSVTTSDEPLPFRPTQVAGFFEPSRYCLAPFSPGASRLARRCSSWRMRMGGNWRYCRGSRSHSPCWHRRAPRPPLVCASIWKAMAMPGPPPRNPAWIRVRTTCWWHVWQWTIRRRMPIWRGPVSSSWHRPANLPSGLIGAFAGGCHQPQPGAGSDETTLRQSRIRAGGVFRGAALALLLAAQRDDVAQVQTLAGNLSPRLWAELKGLSPLNGSLDPLDYRSQLVSLPQRHLVGQRDTVIPSRLPDLYRRALGSPLISNASIYREQATILTGKSHGSAGYSPSLQHYNLRLVFSQDSDQVRRHDLSRPAGSLASSNSHGMTAMPIPPAPFTLTCACCSWKRPFSPERCAGTGTRLVHHLPQLP